MSIAVNEIRYARSGSTNLAYYVTGAGHIDLLMSSWVISIEDLLAHPKIHGFIERLASFSRVILFDQRGVGLSDPVTASDPPTAEQHVLDLLAVLDEVRAQQAAIVGIGNSGAALLAASHPERVTHLVMDHPNARLLEAPDFPSGMPENLLEHELDTAEEELKSARPMGFVRGLPSVINDREALEWWLRSIRRGASPGTMRVLLRAYLETDIRSVLPSVRCPTLIICRRDAESHWLQRAEYVAELLPNATIVRPPGADPVIWVGDLEPVADAIREFTGKGSASEPEYRALTTVLFTDVVDSTRQAAAFGDRRWRELLDHHYTLIADKIGRFSGRLIKTTGDGVLATFDGPARAVRCACAIRDAVAEHEIEVRAGLHTGEIEMRGDDVAGIAVHIGQRVSALAGPGEVLVSRTVTDLVAGSGLEFDDRGEHELKGVPGRWQVYAVKN
jgi:class 3 adenylate cyclase